MTSDKNFETDEARWAAVLARDARADGAFFYGVVTMGIFCRPTCPSRRPNRENARFYATAAEAEADGLRACLRCRPLALEGRDPNAERVARLCRYIDDHLEDSLSLDHLAQVVGLSPFHLQRSFKAITGLSPKAYQDARRMERLKAGLRTGGDVTGAVYEAGYSAPSRAYARVDGHLGMTPGQYRAGGKGQVISYALAESPLGLLMIGATDRGLCFVQFGDDEASLLAQLRAEYPQADCQPMEDGASGALAVWMEALLEHLKTGLPHQDLPLDIKGTAFQWKVWRYLQSIPAGGVQSYAEVAQGIGMPTAARAVARACASNVVALAIPCHRVIRGDGSLSGYRWGVDRKRALLDQERKANAGARR